MPKCSAYGCRSGYEPSTSKGRHYFGIPKESSQAAKWSAALARAGTTLHATSAVCDLHFSDDVLVKNYEHVVQGTLVQIPRGRWRLKPGAVPTMRLASDVEEPVKRKVKQQQRFAAVCSDSQDQSYQSAARDERFTTLVASLAECENLCGWSVHGSSDELVAVCKMSVVDSVVIVDKAVIVRDILGGDVECHGTRCADGALSRIADCPCERCGRAQKTCEPFGHAEDLFWLPRRRRLQRKRTPEDVRSV
ncbi:hypothetical protein HPB50_020996 [Hyalomma asiaticum]|uniref:Uncharacterized protein n=1 Tax=Hyalomma asiaticum TaxID=266040 RepID=A0ACB7T899_HYAAI|nr:hypothetical protein HPB50_020996 [Hyalomma asiaticum]